MKIGIFRCDVQQKVLRSVCRALSSAQLLPIRNSCGKSILPQRLVAVIGHFDYRSYYRARFRAHLRRPMQRGAETHTMSEDRSDIIFSSLW